MPLFCAPQRPCVDSSPSLSMNRKCRCDASPIPRPALTVEVSLLALPAYCLCQLTPTAQEGPEAFPTPLLCSARGFAQRWMTQLDRHLYPTTRWLLLLGLARFESKVFQTHRAPARYVNA